MSSAAWELNKPVSMEITTSLVQADGQDAPALMPHVHATGLSVLLPSPSVSPKSLWRPSSPNLALSQQIFKLTRSPG